MHNMNRINIDRVVYLFVGLKDDFVMTIIFDDDLLIIMIGDGGGGGGGREIL